MTETKASIGKIERAILIGFLYARQAKEGLSKSNQGCWEALNYQLRLALEPPITEEEKEAFNEVENKIWILLKQSRYTHEEQRETRKKIAKYFGGKYENGVIKLD